MFILGLTGGIGAGKSLILHELETNYNSFICETDKLAHKLMKKGTEINAEITKAFGTGILKSDGDIDRYVLGSIVFADDKKLDTLNSIVHPGVKKYILSDIEEKRKLDIDIYVIEAALLIQDGYDKICDQIWNIWADRETRISRLMNNRGYSYEKCISVIDSQPDDDFYAKYTNLTIMNNSKPDFSTKAIKVELNKLGIRGIITQI
jgi:dephospho-CoA kinase